MRKSESLTFCFEVFSSSNRDNNGTWYSLNYPFQAQGLNTYAASSSVVLGSLSPSEGRTKLTEVDHHEQVFEGFTQTVVLASLSLPPGMSLGLNSDVKDLATTPWTKCARIMSQNKSSLLFLSCISWQWYKRNEYNICQL